MFAINDTILYGAHGVCKITAETVQSVGTDQMEYFVLTPVYNPHSTIYVPKKNPALLSRMHRLLSKTEIGDLLQAISADSSAPDAALPGQEEYRTLLASGNRMALLCTVGQLLTRRQELQSKGKKLHIADERFLKDAQRIIHDEFAYSLGIAQEEVASFIRQELDRLSPPCPQHT